MKKIFSILMAVLFAGVLFATPSTSTLTFTAVCGGTGTADDEAAWTITSDGTESTYDATKGIHYGTSSAAVGYIQLSTSDIAGTITSVVVNASAASGVSASVSVTVGEDAFTCESETTAAVSVSATDYTFEGSASGEIVVRLAKAASAKKALYVKSVVVTYEEAEASTTKTYYLTLSSDWAGWPAKYAIYYFKSSDNTQNGWSEFMTAVSKEDNTYIGTIPAGYDKLIFVRFNSEATAPAWDSNKWSQTVDLTAPTNDNDWFTVTSGGTGSECNGVWSKHGEPVIPAKFYITGDSALVTDAGAPGASWNPAAIKSETDTFTLKNLKAGQEYILKLTLNGTWEGENNIKGYNELTEKTPGLKDISNDHNIGFKLNEAGDVQVIYKDGETPVFKLVGNFVVEIPHYFIAGTMTNWKDEMVELLPLEEKADSLGVSLNLKADSLYLYKIVRVQGTDTAWYGLDGDATMEYGNSTGWYIYKSEGEKNQKNVGLQTTKEGDYPVTLVIKEDQLIVSVVIPKPDTKYYAKYADKAGEWNWKLLTEKEGKWLTDTIVYYGGGMNIHSAAEGDGKYFAEIAGVAAKDTAYFSFNPEDSTLVATVVGKYIKPFPVMQIAGQWDMEGENWIVNNMVLAADSLTATYEVSLEKGDYEFKLIKDGKWITKANGGEPYGLHRTWPGVAGVVDEATENLKVTADVSGKYLFTWTFANDSIGITFPDKPDQPEGIGGYYLVGSFNNWVISAAYKFVSNEEANYDEKILRDVTLAVGDELKVVTINDAGDVIRYYPEGADNNYVVDAAHAGVVTVYFTPWANPDWESFHEGGWFFIPSNTGTGIDETADGVKAVKVLRDGQILIIKGEKTYNALGILVE